MVVIPASQTFEPEKWAGRGIPRVGTRISMMVVQILTSDGKSYGTAVVAWSDWRVGRAMKHGLCDVELTLSRELHTLT